MKCIAILFALVSSCLADAVIDACVYPDDATAAKAWLAREGSPPPAMQQADGAAVLTLDCKFATSNVGRGCWDRELNLDLGAAEGLQLDMFCADAGPISSFMVYLKTGGGWRTHTFSLRRTGGWETVIIPKSEMREDGKPGGWDEITALRLAAWKGDNANTSFRIRNLRKFGVLGEDTRIVLVRGADEKDPFGANVSKLLGDLGLHHAFIAESELNGDILSKARLAILPHNPKLPDTATDALIEYLKRDGRLLAFYSIPSKLEEATGIGHGKHTMPAAKGQFSSIRPLSDWLPGAPAVTAQASWNINSATVVEDRSRAIAEWYDAEGKPTGFPAVIASPNTVFMSHVLLDDDRENKARLLLAMVGYLQDGVWREVIEGRRAKLDHIGPFNRFEDVSAHLLKNPGADVGERINGALRMLGDAEKAAKARRFGKALDLQDAALLKVREAWCCAQPSKPDEFRAMWCHSAFGVKGMTWDAAIKRLKDNGFTAIMPNMLWGGVAYYPGEVLPVAESVKEKGDQMAACIEACKKHGVQCHVWKVDWNLGHDVPAAFVEKMRAEGRLQRSFSGEEQPWLCPSNPANVRLELDALLEVARKYPIDGIHFDYIRYPGADHCFCAPCRERFEKATGEPVADWPKDVQMKGVRREQWIPWCQNNITTLVRTTSEEVRKVRPGIKVSAAVFRNWDVDSRIVMQDWKLWCAKGWLDFVCPMDYTTNNGTYDSWVRRQKILAGPAGLVPGIGASSSHSSLAADEVISQIEITRKHDTKGFIIFNYGEREAGEVIPLLGLGATKK
ncbi:MAG: family 10 glycosylhydrolase [Verrucomicrobiaceae bacterium]|nr:family 10 glycosylhydrolase [Verrucomicrobiaceae bacterium]